MQQTHWKAALAGVSFGVIAAIYIGKLPPAIPTLRAEFDLSLGESGWLVSMFNTLGLVASIFMGVFTARVGAWRLCMAALTLMAAGGLAGALAHSATLLLAARFVEGVGFLAVVVSAPALITMATAPGDRKRVFSFWGGYMPTGTTIGMLLAPPLIAAWGWRSLWIAVALASVFAIGMLLALRHDYAAADAATVQGGTAWRDAAGPLSKPGPWWVALAFGCYAFNYYAIMVWLPTFMIGERQIALSTASLLTALMVAVNVPGNVLGGVLMQRGVSRGTNVILAGIVTLLTCVVMFATALPDWARYLGSLGFSFGVGILPGSVMSAAQTHAKNAAHVGTVQGIIVQGSNVGQFASPLLVTAVVAHGAGAALDWGRMFYVVTGAALVIIASGLMIRRIERPLAC